MGVRWNLGFGGHVNIKNHECAGKILSVNVVHTHTQTHTHTHTYNTQVHEPFNTKAAKLDQIATHTLVDTFPPAAVGLVK